MPWEPPDTTEQFSSLMTARTFLTKTMEANMPYTLLKFSISRTFEYLYSCIDLLSFHFILLCTARDSSSRRTWFFPISVNSCPIALSNCQKWIINNSTAGFGHDTCSVDICPPSEDFALASGWPCLNAEPGYEKRTCYRPFARHFGSTGSLGGGDIGVAQTVRILL